MAGRRYKAWDITQATNVLGTLVSLQDPKANLWDLCTPGTSANCLVYPKLPAGSSVNSHTEPASLSCSHTTQLSRGVKSCLREHIRQQSFRQSKATVNVTTALPVLRGGTDSPKRRGRPGGAREGREVLGKAKAGPGALPWWPWLGG